MIKGIVAGITKKKAWSVSVNDEWYGAGFVDTLPFKEGDVISFEVLWREYNGKKYKNINLETVRVEQNAPTPQPKPVPDNASQGEKDNYWEKRNNEIRYQEALKSAIAFVAILADAGALSAEEAIMRDRVRQYAVAFYEKTANAANGIIG
jgi:hypothetical protein